MVKNDAHIKAKSSQWEKISSLYKKTLYVTEN